MKFKVTSWVDKPDYYTGKWYSFFVSDVNLDIIESKFLIIVWIWFVVSAVCSLFLLLNHSSDSCPWLFDWALAASVDLLIYIV